MADPLLVPCPACGATNRVPREKLAAGHQPVCGRCKAPLSLDGFASRSPFDGRGESGLGKPVTVTNATFSAEVECSPLPVVVEVWADWCGPCRMIAPVIDELAGAMAGRVRFAKLNIDQNPATASRFGVQSIPTLLVMKDGREVDRIVGVAPKAEIVRRLERLG